MAGCSPTTARTAGQPEPTAEEEAARLRGVFVALVAAHGLNIDLLSDWDDKATFAERVGIPYVAALLGELGPVLSPDELEEFERWPGKATWLALCREHQ